MADHLAIDSDVDLSDEPEAQTSPGPRSSSPGFTEYNSDPLYDFFVQLVHNLPAEDSASDEDDDFIDPAAGPPKKRVQAQSNDQKARSSLQYMRDNFSRFSLCNFLQTVFASEDSQIKRFSNKFLAEGSHIDIMERWWKARGGVRDSEMADWVVKKAGEVCAKEASNLTDRAYNSPVEADAQFLRVSSKDVNVKLVEEFRLKDLTARYNRVMPHFQQILKAVIGKAIDSTEGGQNGRDTDAGRTLITSIALNLRSRLTNYHATINSLILWKARVPKRIVQMLNQFGVSASYGFQTTAIGALGRSALALAQQVANTASKIKMLPYDNFNWVQRAWESSALHGSISHDEVSALLVVVPTPEGKSAADIMSLSNFGKSRSKRHDLPHRQSLEEILPTDKDEEEFRSNAIIHIQHILSADIKPLSESRFLDATASIMDPKAISPQKTEEYFLPTFDQEQGSTRGNMIVLRHYLLKILDVPKAVFESVAWLILGDRLTAARDRSAQDQRALDRSPDKIDHLSSLKIVNGLMHFNLNFVRALARNYWGRDSGGTASNPVSFSSLRMKLPNRSEINNKKFDYYGWLRFLDVILRALVIQATLQSQGLNSVDDLARMSKLQDDAWLSRIAEQVVDTYLIPSPSRLEATGQKPVKGASTSGNAMLLLHDLMTLREMRHAIKHGHPSRVFRMIKHWLPMFYAAGSYNYANECMELLHNVLHDWPTDFADVALQSMLVNSSGKADGFKETDIRVEHLNDDIKEHAHGANATPALLEKITPSIGHLKNLSDQFFHDIGVEHLNQRHSSVRQSRDVEILLKYMQENNIFNFQLDTPSDPDIVDLYKAGIRALSGTNGGHAKHLARHKLRLNERHGGSEDNELTMAMDMEQVYYTVNEDNVDNLGIDSDEEF